MLASMDGIVICPGFGQRGIDGKLIATQYCREHDIPTFGICLGMQMRSLNLLATCCSIMDADSIEMDPKTHHKCD